MTITSKIREELKTLGYSNRKISVTEDSGCTVTAIFVSIKDKSIDINEIYGVVSKYEKQNSCEITNDILQGGTTCIFTRYAS